MGEEEQSGVRPVIIVDKPPEPDPPAYPKPPPVAASAEGGTGDGKTNKRFEEIERKLKDFDERLRTLVDTIAASAREAEARVNALGEVAERIEGALGRANIDVIREDIGAFAGWLENINPRLEAVEAFIASARSVD